MFDRFRSRNAALDDEAIGLVVGLGHAPSAAQLAALEAWCARSPAHAQAVRQARSLLLDVSRTGTAEEHRAWVRALTPLPIPRRFSRRAVLLGGASAACVAVVGGLTASGVLLGPPAGLLADQSTRIGQRRRVELPDGSMAWLNTASAVSFEFSGALRRVIVEAGEALFDVVDDTARPFAVQCGDGELRSQAGRFAVRRGAGFSSVIVDSGGVDLGCRAGSTRVMGNQRVAFSRDVLGVAESIDARALTAWTRGKLIFQQQTVADVASELERYMASCIVVVGERLRGLELSGVFDLDDPGALLRSVADLADAKVLTLPLMVVLR